MFFGRHLLYIFCIGLVCFSVAGCYKVKHGYRFSANSRGTQLSLVPGIATKEDVKNALGSPTFKDRLATEELYVYGSYIKYDFLFVRGFERYRQIVAYYFNADDILVKVVEIKQNTVPPMVGATISFDFPHPNPLWTLPLHAIF